MGDFSPINVRSGFQNESLTTCSSSLATYTFSFPHSVNEFRVSPSSNHTTSDQNTNCHDFMDTQTARCEPVQQFLSRNQFSVHENSYSNSFDYKQFRQRNAIDTNPSAKSMVYGNQNGENNSRESPAARLKIALQRLNSLPLRSCHTFNESKNSDVCLLPSSHGVHKLHKSASLSSDFDMSCNSSAGTIHPSDNPTAAVNQDMSLVHGLALGRSMSSEHSLLTSMTVTSTAYGALVYQSMARFSTPVTSKSLLSHYVSDHCQPSLLTTSTGSSAPSSASTSTTAHGEESINECPSPQVSDLGSEDTHVSVSQQTFLQSYGNLTPWTSKITTPGYIPLPKPSSDAMPIPMEHISQENMLRMSSPFSETSPQSWHARPNHTYSHLKPRLSVDSHHETVSNNKIKNRSSCASMHAHRPKLTPNKEYQFRRTADALHKSGLWEVAMKTGSLMKRNRELQKELEEFRSDAVAFLKSVIKNPQNRGFIKNILKTALTSNNGSHNDASVMTVVVSAAAAAVASVKMDTGSSSDDSMSGNAST